MLHNQTFAGYDIEIPVNIGKYEILECIGSGSFSVVYKVRSLSTGENYSAKVISMKDMTDKDSIESVSNEINILQKVDHRNVVKYIESFNVSNELGEELFVIVTEFCCNGNLYDFIQNGELKDRKRVKPIIEGVAEGLRYLHSIGVAHCDIKLGNILLDDEFLPKLCDFNLSKEVIDGERGICGGTFMYSAPEIQFEQPVDFFKADIWSFGITIFVICEQAFPFCQDGEGNYNTDYLAYETRDKELNEVIDKCTMENPEDRIDADQILHESYFAKVSKDCYSYYLDDKNERKQSAYNNGEIID